MSLRVTIAVGLIAIPLLMLANTRPEPWVAIDGDTIQHGDERIRLLAIDAPEMPGHCRPGRQCVPGDPYRAQRALQHALDSGNVECVGTRRDRYGRRLAICTVTAGNTSVDIGEWLLARGYAAPYHGGNRGR